MKSSGARPSTIRFLYILSYGYFSEGARRFCTPKAGFLPQISERVETIATKHRTDHTSPAQGHILMNPVGKLAKLSSYHVLRLSAWHLHVEEAPQSIFHPDQI
jgi:hypothetical protein